MKKIIIRILIITIFSLTACLPGLTNTSGSITITDALNREVIFERSPERIVIAGRQTPMLTHFFYLFETADEKIAAIENRTQSTEQFIGLIDDQIESKYLLERGATAEQITPLNPDTVVLKTIMRESVGLQLENLGIPVVYVEFESIDNIFRDVKILAALLNEQSRGEEIINKYREMKTEIDSMISENSHQPNISVLILQSEKEDQLTTFSVPSANWLQTAMIESLGAYPIWKKAAQTGGWMDVNLEQIAFWDPDIIFLVNYQGKAPEILKDILNNEVWQQLSAVKNDRTHPFIYDFISWDQPDPRWILAYSWMANKIYPDLVDSVHVQQDIDRFFIEFFRITNNQFTMEMNSRLSEYLK